MSTITTTVTPAWAQPVLALQQAILSNHATSVVDWVAANADMHTGVTATRRIEIYSHAYRARLHDVLADTYERVHAWLGDEGFEKAAYAYIEAYPPDSPTLRDFGAYFAEHLAKIYPHDLEITELAQLDWALRQAFDAPNETPLDISALSSLMAQPVLDWTALRLIFTSSVQLLHFTMNTLSLWQVLSSNEIGDSETNAATIPQPVALTQPNPVLVWRQGWQPHFCSISPVVAVLFKQLQGKATLAEACQQASAQYGDGAIQTALGEALHTWFNEGLITAMN